MRKRHHSGSKLSSRERGRRNVIHQYSDMYLVGDANICGGIIWVAEVEISGRNRKAVLAPIVAVRSPVKTGAKFTGVVLTGRTCGRITGNTFG